MLNAFCVFAFVGQKIPLANFLGQKREVPVNGGGLAKDRNLKAVCRNQSQINGPMLMLLLSANFCSVSWN
jgi:hypothetical protein